MKILLIRFSSIGDIVLTSPVIRCLKEQLGAELHYLSKKSFATLLEYNPHLSKCYYLQTSLNELIPELNAEKYDLIIDLHNNLRSRILSGRLRIPTLRFNKLNIRKWLFTSLKLDLLPKKHLVDRYFESLSKTGIQNDGKGLEYYSKPEPDLLRNFDLAAGSFAVLAIGGTYATKRMTNNQIRLLIKRLNKPCVIIGGGEADEQNAAIICQDQDPEKCKNLVNQINLNESAELIRHSALVVCHDSGMMHIAAAFRKQMVSVWGNTHPKFGMYPYLPEEYQSSSALFQVELGCRPCSKLGYNSCPKKHFNCMKMQNVDEIVKKCNSVLDRQ